jgi:hypothetical protein
MRLNFCRGMLRARLPEQRAVGTRSDDAYKHQMMTTGHAQQPQNTGMTCLLPYYDRRRTAQTALGSPAGSARHGVMMMLRSFLFSCADFLHSAPGVDAAAIAQQLRLLVL